MYMDNMRSTAPESGNDNVERGLMLLFERPLEPVFLPKNNDEALTVPENYLVDEYKPIYAPMMSPTFGGDVLDRMPVEEVPQLPDLSFPLKLGKYENFSLFCPYHMDMASELIRIFISQPTQKELLSVATYVHDRCNPYMFIYAFSVAVLHRKDTKNLEVPLLHKTFPEKYISPSVITHAKEQYAINKATASAAPAMAPPAGADPSWRPPPPEIKKTVVVMPRDFTATDLDDEHKVAYFREDLGVNLHHWHWHVVYPHNAAKDYVELLVRKDRRGELFYYMHQQILARYNFERFSCNLARVERLNNLREPIPEAYFPKLTTQLGTYNFAPRVANSKITDLNRMKKESMKCDVDDLERWRDRIYEAIHSGFVRTRDGKLLPLDEETGIDILGNMVEGSAISVNPTLYGDLHNMGHAMIAFTHDPDYRHLETGGVLGDVATAMRDPVFYRWHSFINSILQEHKNQLRKYTKDDFLFNGISIEDVELDVEGGPKNQFQTFWQESVIDLTNGMNFNEAKEVNVCFTHLQYQPFTYKIKVRNNLNKTTHATCRIFLAPKYDEAAREAEPFLYCDQKDMFIEMDKFTVTLIKGATSMITRKASASSVIIPYEQIAGKKSKKVGQFDNLRPNFCGCGWPENMLVPKGWKHGMACQLFVMFTDYENDKVEETSDFLLPDQSEPAVPKIQTDDMCLKTSPSYCGLRGKKYPDKKPMGFPFDRSALYFHPERGWKEVRNFSRFVEEIPNACLKDVTILHTGETRKSPECVGDAPEGYNARLYTPDI